MLLLAGTTYVPVLLWLLIEAAAGTFTVQMLFGLLAPLLVVVPILLTFVLANGSMTSRKYPMTWTQNLEESETARTQPHDW
jgi:hypothetical protein